MASGKWDDLTMTQRAALMDKPWSGFTSDQRAAMQVLKENSTEYNINPGQVVISGFSAGGHLAALYSSICREDGRPCPQAQVLHYPYLKTGAKIFCSDVGSTYDNLEDYLSAFLRLLSMKTLHQQSYFILAETQSFQR